MTVVPRLQKKREDSVDKKRWMVFRGWNSVNQSCELQLVAFLIHLDGHVIEISCLIALLLHKNAHASYKLLSLLAH